MVAQLIQFPTLYKATATGAIQFWTISVEALDFHGGVIKGVPAEIVTRFGQLDTDRPQETRDKITEGKNLGKKNETTPADQACAEARAKWEKQKKKGYVEDLLRAQGRDNDLKGVPCMLAHKYSQHAEKIKFPAACQPKLDGIRCLTKSDGTLWSRTQKPITSVPHISGMLRERFPSEVPPLDGELYTHELRANFERIVSIVRQTTKVDPQHELVQFHVYDLALPGATFAERHAALADLVAALGPTSPIRLVETRIVNSHEELMEAFEAFRAQGYEGAMVRNLDAPYEGKRSYGLQKVKEFDSAEFRIVGCCEGRGKLQGHVAAFQCVTPAGAPFEAKMEGELGRLKAYFEDHALWRGKLLEVKFQGYTTKNRVPRFPVGLRFRDDI